MGIFKAIGNAVGKAFPIISTAASLASTLLTNKANKKRQDEMNEYNSPAAQLRRYKEAGINPGYGAGINAGNQSSVVQMQAPDVGAAVDAGGKAIAWKEHYQNIRNAQVQEQKLAADVRNQNIVAEFAEQTLKDRTDQERLKSIGMQYQNVGQLSDATVKEFDANNVRLLSEIGVNPRLMSYFKDSALLKKLGLENVGATIANKLAEQRYDYLKKSNAINYQLDQQKFKQLEVINPLDAAIAKLKASGVSFSDPLMLRLMALSSMEGKGYYGSQIIGPAMIDYTTGKIPIPKLW